MLMLLNFGHTDADGQSINYYQLNNRRVELKKIRCSLKFSKAVLFAQKRVFRLFLRIATKHLFLHMFSALAHVRNIVKMNVWSYFWKTSRTSLALKLNKFTQVNYFFLHFILTSLLIHCQRVAVYTLEVHLQMLQFQAVVHPFPSVCVTTVFRKPTVADSFCIADLFLYCLIQF